MNLIRKIHTVVLSAVVTFSFNPGAAAQSAAVPFTVEVADPVIPDRTVSVSDFGGAGDAVTLNTDAFRQGIEALSARGGGRLLVPEGVWLTGPIVLEDNIDLHLAENCIIVFSADKDLYPIVPVWFEGRQTYRCQSPVSARGRSNISITGKGIIDGNGEPWRAVKRGKVSPWEWDRIVAGGGVLREDGETWYPSESFKLGAADSDLNITRWATTMEDFESIRDYLRPVMIYMEDCDNIKLEGVIFQNSPCWNVHLVLSRGIIIDDVLVRCPWYAQNGDGLDIESCDRVIVRNCTLDVGDDAICIKSGKDEEGRRRGVPSSNILVDNCTVFHGHGGFVVGSEMSGGVRNVAVTNCRFSGTDVGLRFKSTRGRGGVVENIYIDNIVMNDIATEALLFDLFYGGKSASEALEDGDEGPVTDMPAMPVDETTPEFRDIYISNVVCRGARRAMLFNGLPEKNVSNVVVRNSYIEAEIGAQINESTSVVLDNVTIAPRTGPALMVNNASELVIGGLKTVEGVDTVLEVTGSRNSGIVVNPGAANPANTVISPRSRGSVVFN
ncbi:MAG: glycoside hydrolase family 28 protein [Rikenellaceae bacterium]|nr:glycoside hydrolase family 28 protein [Rikenellaceae bacterium]